MDDRVAVWEGGVICQGVMRLFKSTLIGGYALAKPTPPLDMNIQSPYCSIDTCVKSRGESTSVRVMVLMPPAVHDSWAPIPEDPAVAVVIVEAVTSTVTTVVETVCGAPHYNPIPAPAAAFITPCKLDKS